MFFSAYVLGDRGTEFVLKYYLLLFIRIELLL